MATSSAGLRRLSSAVFRRMCTAAAEASGAFSPASASPVGTTAAAAAAAPKEKPLYRRLSALGGAPKGAVASTMNKWLREGRSVKSEKIIKCVKQLRKYKRFEHALELMEWMDSRSMNMSYSNYAVRLDLICKVEGIDSAEKYFSRLSQPAKNRLTYGALLNCYATETKEDKALTLFEEMKQQDFVSNALPYNCMMTLYMRLGRPENVPKIMHEMVEKNIPPDGFTHSVLMNSYAAVKDIERVEHTLEEMKKSDAVKVKWPIYGNLAAAYISAGLIEKAQSALNILEENIDRGDRECFHFLITLYAGVGKLEDVKRVWNSLKAAFPTTLNMSYLTLLESLSRMDELDALKQSFQEWESSCSTYDIRLANVLFRAYLRRDMIEEAESLWAVVMQKGVEPNSRTYEMYIDYCLKKHRTDLALKYVEDAALKVKNKRWKLNGEKVDVFLRCFEEHKDFDGAEAFCNTMEKLDCLDSDAYASLCRIRESRAVVNQQCEGDQSQIQEASELTSSELSCRR